MPKGGIEAHRTGLRALPHPWGSSQMGSHPPDPHPGVPRSPRRRSFGHRRGFPGGTGRRRDPPRSVRSVGRRGWRRRAWRPAAPGAPAPSARPCRPGPPRRAVPTRGTRRGRGARPAVPACLGTRTVGAGTGTRSTRPLCAQISAAPTQLLPILLFIFFFKLRSTKVLCSDIFKNVMFLLPGARSRAQHRCKGGCSARGWAVRADLFPSSCPGAEGAALAPHRGARGAVGCRAVGHRDAGHRPHSGAAWEPFAARLGSR